MVEDRHGCRGMGIGSGSRDREQGAESRAQGSIHNDNMTCKSFVKAADGDKQCINRDRGRKSE